MDSTIHGETVRTWRQRSIDSRPYPYWAARFVNDARHLSVLSSCPECPFRPTRFLVCVTADDLDRTEDMLNKLFPLVSPRDLLILLHVIDESVDYAVEGETEDEGKVNHSLSCFFFPD